MVAFGKNRVIGGALLLLIMAGNALGAYANAPAGKPKLVVLIVAQALTLSGMNRFADKFGTGGLRYLSETGANFTNCRFASASAQSASGSATIVTGAYPWAHGIISDQWFDRRKGKTISC
ncbi:MAG: alkaline phosphatase family protein, partial [Cyanobacteria bacterium SZAS LIN-2]|nr:alkaline phosphatase family protein [Cyanobacteria bacterium SZAS LIN-2]